MFNTSTLPGSIALPHSTELPELQGLYYTAKEGKDETPIYQVLNRRLMQLETSRELYEDELNAIEESSVDLVVSIDAKEEVQLRIDWLKRLYEVKISLPTVSTFAELERLHVTLSSVQTCPMRSELLRALDQLAATLPAETELRVQNEFDRVMEMAIEQAGEVFINLGKAGRENIVQGALEEFGGSVSIDYLKEATMSLEQQVARLAEADNEEAFQTQLNYLPLPHYANLSVERKQIVTKQLLEKRNWKGLASLDRMILHVDSALNKVEEQYTLQSMEIGAVTSLDLKHFDDLAILVR